MSLAQLLSEYGYVAVLVGSLLEGETILLLAGFAAHEGYLSLPWVMAVACLGGTLGDQAFYFIGRRWGVPLMHRMPALQPGARRVRALLLRYHAWVIVGVRFMYGLRIVGPIAIGMCQVPRLRFLWFNVLGAVLWALLIPSVGFAFGRSIQAVFGSAERWGLVGVSCLVALVWSVVGWRRRRRRRRDP